MDANRFDLLTRAMGDATSRRTILGALAGLVASPIAAGARRRHRGPASEGPCGDGSRKDNICADDSDCCTGICNTGTGKTNKDGEGRCRCVRKGKPCAEDRNCCAGRACVAGICGGNPVPPPPPPTCDSSNCAAGCCDGATCVPHANQSNSSCGTGGAACAACTGSDTCSASGVCTPPAPTCDSSNCAAGCCDGTTCVPFASQGNGSCGAGGAACSACPSSDTCNGSGVCISPTCDSSNCAAGCCSGTTCVPYANQSIGECGTGGSTCSQCPVNGSCLNGQCTFPN